MKKASFVALVAAILCCGLSACRTEQKREMKLSALTEQFKDPAGEFRTAPFFVWNTDVTTADIDRMLTEMKEAGCGGAFLHPRPGLETEYLSEEWFQLWDYALQKGKELGIDIWIYDENSYPSGFAGGHVPAEMPEAYNQGSCLVGKLTQLPPAPDSCFLCVLQEGETFTDITAQLADYQGKEGIYYCYSPGNYGASAWTGGYPYVDLLAKGVTEKFIEVTFTNGYEKYLGHELGKSIKGTFTDEPNIATPMGGHCRWTPDLFDVFQARWGYDLRPYWPLLGEEVGPWQKVRHDYNATLLQLFIERWAKPWYEYTEKHGMAFTGHYWEHDWPVLTQGPDNMAMYAWHQIPAIDMLFNQYDDSGRTQAQFGNVRAVKELRSVANQMGYTRTLSETYGGGGWDETLEDMKRLGDWEYALGVNFMNQHLAHMTITGVRKYDYPPEFTSISPWWQDYRQQNDYFARLSLMLSQGEQLNTWLIMEPTTSLWMHYTQVGGGAPVWEIANGFQNFITFLEKQQMEYDLGCEQIIADHGKVTKGGFCVGQRTYTTVVLPPAMKNLELSTFRLLKQFAEQGGRVIACAELAYVDGEENEELKSFMQSDNVLKMERQEDVLALFQQESTTKIALSAGKHVFHQRRTFDDGELFFFVNSSKEETAELTLYVPGKYIAEWDAATGNIYKVETDARDACYDGGLLTLNVTLPPVGSKLYVISDKEIGNPQERPNVTYGEPLQPTGDMQIEPLRDNALALDFCNLSVDDERHEAIFYKEANSRLWAHFHRSDPWETAVQYKRTILETDTFTTGRIAVDYPVLISDDVDLSAAHIIVERPDLWQVSVNGTPVSDYTQDKLLDARCGDFQIGTLLHQGENVVTLHREHMSIHAEIAPVMLLGRFAVLPHDKGFRIAKPEPIALGDYAHQPCPMYAWEMCYHRTYNVENPAAPHRIRLGLWSGTVAEVWVNGQKLGAIYNQPYEADLTGALQEGENIVEVRVIGSLANLYGPHYAQPTGLMGPWQWNGVGAQLPGADYHLFPYGLYEEFVVESGK